MLTGLSEVGSPGVPRFVAMLLDATRCTVAAALGEHTVAAAAYARVLPHADLHVTNGAGVSFTLGSAHLSLGLAARALDRPDDAVDHLHAAVRANDHAGLIPFTAEARYQLAATLHARNRSDDRDLALRQARLAEQTAEQLGMAPLRAKASALTEQLTGRQETDPLTGRQREIAELVARGRSNREIAAELHISLRTAENHLRNIMLALGVGNRVQIATWILGDSPRRSG